MYRDLIEAPERYEVNGHEWWVQIMHRSNGDIDCVNVYDDDGRFVIDFKTEQEALDYIKNRS